MVISLELPCRISAIEYGLISAVKEVGDPNSAMLIHFPTTGFECYPLYYSFWRSSLSACLYPFHDDCRSTEGTHVPSNVHDEYFDSFAGVALFSLAMFSSAGFLKIERFIELWSLVRYTRQYMTLLDAGVELVVPYDL